MSSTKNEVSILSNWLEEKLKEHFVKKSQLRKTGWNIFTRGGEPEFSSFFVPNQGNGVVPIQTAVSDFRILEFKLERDKNKSKKNESQHYSGNLLESNHDYHRHHHRDQDPEDVNPPDEMFLPFSPSSAAGEAFETEDLYQQQNSHVYLVYQETSQSVGKELFLNIQASQLDDLQAMENSFPKYELLLEQQQIDMYTRVFPLLKHWAYYKDVPVTLPVAECYYGSYETANCKGSFGLAAEFGDDGSEDSKRFTDTITDYMLEDDILSKVAAGLEFHERDEQRRKRKESNRRAPKSGGGEGKQSSSYRLLILEDICRQGFKVKTVGPSSTFLSLLNVEEALKSLAEIHSLSWAYAQLSGKSLLKTWRFLNNPMYMPYVKERVIPGFSAMTRLVRAYLISSQVEEDGQKIMQSLTDLIPHLEQILEGAYYPRMVKCVIHQSPCFSSFLFRYSLLNRTPEKKKKIKAAQWLQQKTRGGGDDDDDNYVENQTNKDDIDNKNNDDKANKKGKTCLLNSPNEDDNYDYGVSQKAERTGLEKKLSREVMIINWRTASVGSPMIDVAFLLLTALPPQTRRSETAALLRIYWNTFRLHARKFGLTLAWSDQELYGDYLGALLYTCVLITGNITGSQCDLDEEGMQVFIEAVKDLMREKVI